MADTVKSNDLPPAMPYPPPSDPSYPPPPDAMPHHPTAASMPPPPAQAYTATAVPPAPGAPPMATANAYAPQPGMTPMGAPPSFAAPLQTLQSTSTPVDCPVCRQRAYTSLSYETGDMTHIAAIVVCCFTCLGCIPYMLDMFKDVKHSCGSCGAPLAVYKRSGGTMVLNVHQ